MFYKIFKVNLVFVQTLCKFDVGVLRIFTLYLPLVFNKERKRICVGKLPGISSGST